MDGKVFNPEEKAKVTQIINEGMQVLTEVQSLNEGLNDTIKAVAEELDIKPSVLKKAIKVAHKCELQKTQEEQELLETLLELAGRTL